MANSKCLLGFTLLLVVSLLIPAVYYHASNNFYEVDPGKLYRSKQLTKREFGDLIDRYGIKSIISLRRPESEEPWYQDEVAVAAESKVEHLSIRMSPARLPHKKDVIKLLDAYKNSPKPILIHCRGGSDRTGLADALYRMEHMGQSKEKASEALSLKYYHFSWVQPSKKYFLELYQGADWVKETYNPCQPSYAYYNRAKYCQSSS